MWRCKDQENEARKRCCHREWLAWAARANIDCGWVEAKSLPAGPEVPAFVWACWHGRVQSLHDPIEFGVILQSVTGAANDRSV